MLVDKYFRLLLQSNLPQYHAYFDLWFTSTQSKSADTWQAVNLVWQLNKKFEKPLFRPHKTLTRLRGKPL